MKRTRGDELIGVVMRMYGNNTRKLLRLAKRHVSLLIFYRFFSYKIGEQEGRTGPAGCMCVGGGLVPVEGGRWWGKE
jgi:hypothetical protein